MSSRPAGPCPWEQLPGEPEEAFDAFAGYLRHPDAGIAGYVRAAGLSSSTPALAARWRWKARRAALRAHLQGVEIAAAEESAADVGEVLGRTMTELAVWALESVLARRARGEELDPRESLAAVQLLADQVALAQGRPTQRIELTGHSDAVLAAMDALMQGDEDRARAALLEPEGPPEEG